MSVSSSRESAAGSDARAVLPRPARQIQATSQSLQAVRALACLLVVFFHVDDSIFGLPKYWPDHPFGRLFSFGHAGVEVFFVLSGYIIFAAHRRDVGIAERFTGFLWKRIRRIYPVYWMLLLALLPVYMLMPSFGGGAKTGACALANSLLLMRVCGHGEAILGVSWTLFHEVLFYAVFSLLILNERLGRLALGAWLAGSLAALLIGTAALPAGLAFVLSPLHLLFGLGIAAAALGNARRIRHPWLLLAAGVALFLGSGAEEVLLGRIGHDALSLLYGLGAAMAMLAAVTLERAGSLRIPRPLSRLGDASYSIYLVHQVAMSALAKLALVVVARIALPEDVIFLGLVTLSVASGIVYHLFVEVPLLALVGRRIVAALPASPALPRTADAWS